MSLNLLAFHSFLFSVQGEEKVTGPCLVSREAVSALYILGWVVSCSVTVDLPLARFSLLQLFMTDCITEMSQHSET